MYFHFFVNNLAVYNPHPVGAELSPRIEIYTKQVFRASNITDPEKAYLADLKEYPANDMTKSWKLAASSSLPVAAGDLVTLSVGDTNKDGVDDLVVAGNYGATVYHGKLDTGLREKNSALLLSPQKDERYGAVVFRSKKEPGSGESTMIGVISRNVSQTQIVNTPTSTLCIFECQYKDDGSISYEKIAEMDQIQSSYPTRITCISQVELVFLNQAFLTAYSPAGAVYQNGHLTKVLYPDMLAPADNKFIYDLQTATLNGRTVDLTDDAEKQGGKEVSVKNAGQTVFFKQFDIGLAEPVHRLGAFTTGGGTMLNPNSTADTSKPPFYAILNTDNDTSYLTYQNDHRVMYSDPAVLAVLSAPPYFKDLLSHGAGSGSTSFGQTDETTHAVTSGSSIEAGIFLGYEHEVSVAGVPIASVEMEAELKTGLTKEFEDSQTVSLTTTWESSLGENSGADTVVFYSVPYDVYTYKIVTYEDDPKTPGEVNKDETEYVVSVPRTPCTSTMDLGNYRKIAAAYGELPQLPDDLLRHTVGKPESYPSSISGFSNTQCAKGFQALSFSKADGNISQEISIGTEHTESYTQSIEMSFKVGGGAGGFKAGVEGATGSQSGTADTTFQGSIFGGSIGVLPMEAQDAGYSFSWQLFSHEGSYVNAAGNTVKFPIVDYQVKDVTQPPQMPQDIRQDITRSTMNSICLNWEYDDPATAEGFNVYRIDQNVVTLIGAVPASAGVLNEDGTYTYEIMDEGQNARNSLKNTKLRPGTEYQYRITAVNSRNPFMYSVETNPLTASTLYALEYPDIELQGVTNNHLTVYPKTRYKITAVIKNLDSENIDSKNISYQWQKLDKNHKWADLKDCDSEVLFIEEPLPGIVPSESSVGSYRCKVNASVYGYDEDTKASKRVGVETYSEVFDTDFRMFTPVLEAFSVSSEETAKEGRTAYKPVASLTLRPSASDPNSYEPPTGNVVFIIDSPDYSKSYTVPLVSGTGSSTATLSDTVVRDAMGAGLYTVSAYYSGDVRFGSLTSEPQMLLCGDSAPYPVLFNKETRTNTFYYGDTMTVKVFNYVKNEDGTITETELDPEWKYPEGSTEKVLTDKNGEIGSHQDSIMMKKGSETYYLPYTYTVKKLPLDVRVTSEKPLYVKQFQTKDLPGFEESNKTVPKEQLEKIVTLTYKDSDNNAVSDADLVALTSGGDYQAILTPAASDELKHYDLTLHSAAFRIRNLPHALQLSVTDPETGSITMTSPEQKKGITSNQIKTDTSVTFPQYDEGDTITLTAVPNAGYQFDHWKIGSKTITQKTISQKMPDDDLTIEASFKLCTGTVILDETNSKGTVEKPEGFSNDTKYPVDETVLTFTAVNNESYAFDHWVMIVNGITQPEITEPRITVTVTEEPIRLIPVFRLAPCKITLGDHIIGTYSYTEDTKVISGKLVSGTQVPVNTKLTLQADGIGSDVKFAWYVNGEKKAENQPSFEWTVEGNTSVELKTAEQSSTSQTTDTTSTTSATTTTSATNPTTTTTAVTTTTEATTTTSTTPAGTEPKKITVTEGETTVIDVSNIPNVQIKQTVGEYLEADVQDGKLNVKVMAGFTGGEIVLADPATKTEYRYVFVKAPAYSFKYDVTGKNHFYTAEEISVLKAEDLIASLKRAVVSTNEADSAWETITDYSTIDLKNVTAKQLFDAQDMPFCKVAVTAEITGTLPDGQVQTDTITLGYALIAKQGDVNLDGSVNAKDANEVLIYAAKAGTGSDPDLYGGTDAEKEQFGQFIANVNGDGSINAKDANLILIYAAKIGTGQKVSFKDIQ